MQLQPIEPPPDEEIEIRREVLNRSRIREIPHRKPRSFPEKALISLALIRFALDGQRGPSNPLRALGQTKA